MIFCRCAAGRFSHRFSSKRHINTNCMKALPSMAGRSERSAIDNRMRHNCLALLGSTHELGLRAQALTRTPNPIHPKAAASRCTPKAELNRGMRRRMRGARCTRGGGDGVACPARTPQPADLLRDLPAPRAARAWSASPRRCEAAGHDVRLIDLQVLTPRGRARARSTPGSPTRSASRSTTWPTSPR